MALSEAEVHWRAFLDSLIRRGLRGVKYIANHGRVEIREHWLMAVPEHVKRATKYWAKLQTIAMVRHQQQQLFPDRPQTYS